MARDPRCGSATSQGRDLQRVGTNGATDARRAKCGCRRAFNGAAKNPDEAQTFRLLEYDSRTPRVKAETRLAYSTLSILSCPLPCAV